MALAFSDWKRALVLSAGSASDAVTQLGDFVLRLFWEDGCEPTLAAFMDYAQAGLCNRFRIYADQDDRHPDRERGPRMPSPEDPAA
jgi:hypothetical protein